MRKIVFLDNDHLERSQEELTYAVCPFYFSAGISDEILDKLDIENNIEIISDVHQKDLKKILKDVIDNDKIILTWSMYTYTHLNSLGQLETMLRFVARNQISNVTYIDSSGNIEQALNILVRNSKNPWQILQAIETNNIISVDTDIEEDIQMFRVRLELKGMYNDFLKREKIDIFELITT